MALVFHLEADKLRLVTSHRVGSNRRGPALDAGRPLTRNDEREVLRLLDGRVNAEPSLGWVPPRLLAEQGRAVLWFVPGRVRQMTLATMDGIERVQVHYPNLVFGLSERQNLSVVAVAGSERPGPDTPVFHCPTGNVYSDGRVCIGNSTVPHEIGRAAMAGWERMFFDQSAFTHSNHNQWIAGQPGRDADAWWISHAKKAAGKRPFPKRLLSPMGATLGQWWQP